MFFYRSRLIRYIISLVVTILLVQSIRHTFSTPHYIYNVEVHQFVPDNLRHTVRKSSSNYTVADLLNITKLSDNTENDPSDSADNPIHLITQWYRETNLRRRQELISVLHMNVINTAITQIHFIQDSKECTVYNDIEIDERFPFDLLKSKLIIHYNEDFNRNQRLTIKEALQYANRFITNGYTVLLNLDIFFDQSLSILQHRPLLDKKTVLYLSRYEVDPTITTLGLQCSDEHYVGSHDAFIFQTPISNDIVEKFPFEIGTWHIEVKIIYELIQENYTVRNPCKSIRIWHLHSSQIRHRLMPFKKYVLDKRLSDVMRKPEFL